MRKINGKLMTTVYKSNIIKFKLDEYPIHRQIYFLTFVESLERIFSQYKDTYKVLLEFRKIGGEDIKYFVKNSIRNLLISNIDVHVRRLIASFPVDGVKQLHCANMNFSDKIKYERVSIK